MMDSKTNNRFLMMTCRYCMIHHNLYMNYNMSLFPKIDVLRKQCNYNLSQNIRHMMMSRHNMMIQKDMNLNDILCNGLLYLRMLHNHQRMEYCIFYQNQEDIHLCIFDIHHLILQHSFHHHFLNKSQRTNGILRNNLCR